MSALAKKETLAHYPRPTETVPPLDVEALRRQYTASPLAQEEDTFALIRIIGNDLPPRHQVGQGRSNLEFILSHEPEFTGCRKIWVLNRIVVQEELTKLKALLEEYGKEYHEIPFDEAEYAKIGWDIESFPYPGFLESREFQALDADRRSVALDQLYRHKNNYVMHNNGARNFALRLGRSVAKWVLPWDGNCFLTSGGWDEIRSSIANRPYLMAVIVPMARVTENDQLLDLTFRPQAAEEPQIIFRRDVVEEFNIDYRYGRRPKVEMLWRLGVPGPWDRWRNSSWDVPFPRLSSVCGNHQTAGWVARLNSGAGALEQGDKTSFKSRGMARQAAVRSFLDSIDARLLSQRTSSDQLLSVRIDFLRRQRLAHQSGPHPLGQVFDQLLRDADAALSRERLSVVDKETLPPSGNRHDYWHPAPYWWPNPASPDGLPYVRRDGERVAGTQMYASESSRYDRTSAQYMFDDVFILALAAFVTGTPTYGERAATHLKVWFADEATRMTPHLRYAQVRLGHNGNKGASTGIIEFKDLYYMLDGVKILRHEGYIGDSLQKQLVEWFQSYLDWLKNSEQGNRERAARNNHGVLYDLQVLAVAHFVGDWQEVMQVVRRAQDRMGDHFAKDGSQPHELVRTLTKHYCAFNLQSWLNLAHSLEPLGVDLWNYRSIDGTGLETAVRWLLSFRAREWPFPQIEPFDNDRLDPLAYASAERYPWLLHEATAGINVGDVKARFWPHDGVRPFWQVA